MKSILLKILIALFVCGSLVIIVVLLLEKQNEESAETMKVQTINTLQYEFKEGNPSLNFIDRARQLEATRILVTTAHGTETAGYPDDSNDFAKINT